FTASMLAGCSGAHTPEPVAPPKPIASAAPSGLTALLSAAPSASADPAPAPVVEGPKSCPANMALVEGDYCTEIEQTCIKEWWAESNKKHVCEEFEPHTECKGAKIHKRYC